jgi:hypothetical protein
MYSLVSLAQLILVFSFSHLDPPWLVRSPMLTGRGAWMIESHLVLL